MAFGKCGKTQQLPTVKGCRADLSDLKAAFGQSAGLIKHYRVCSRQRLDIISAFDKYSLTGRAADAAKEGQRNGNDQRAGAGDHQKGQSADKPSGKACPKVARKQRRQDRERRGGDYYRRGVPTGKAAYKAFAFGFVLIGGLHQLKNFSGGGVAVAVCYLNVKQA